MDPQHIIDVCEANWDANKDDCNHFVKAAADTLGVAIFSAGDDADAILNKLASAAGWSSIPAIPNLSAVENAAAAGQFIIAGLKSQDFDPPRAHGHVVVVVKGDDPVHPGFPMAYWGQLGGVGQKNSSIRNSFNPTKDLPNVSYYGTSLADFIMSFAGRAIGAGDLADVKTAIESLISTIVTTVEKPGKNTEADRIFFPNGIEMINIEVKAGPVDVNVKVAGPKSNVSAE